MTCPEGCEEHNDACASCWRERSLFFERQALEGDQRLREAAKVCRKRTAERDEARAELAAGDELCRWHVRDRDEAIRDRDEARAELGCKRLCPTCEEHYSDPNSLETCPVCETHAHNTGLRQILKEIWDATEETCADWRAVGGYFATLRQERDEARQVAHELCFPPEGRTQAVLREICTRYPWICRDKEPW